MQWSGQYDTPHICARDKNGNEANLQKTELPVCYTDLYLKICFILWRCEDDQEQAENSFLSRSKPVAELLLVQEQAEKFFGHKKLLRPAVVPPDFRSLTHLIRHGPWNMYNRNCVLHCGATKYHATI